MHQVFLYFIRSKPQKIMLTYASFYTQIPLDLARLNTPLTHPEAFIAYYMV